MTAYPTVGVGLPIVGPHATPEAVELIAMAADRLGFHSLSVSERLLLPGDPDWANDFGLPQWPSYDAIESLTWAAAKTARVRLRTDIIVPLFQQPVVLARRLATLDRLSGGRLDVGVARGWLPEEFAATGVDHDDKGAAYEESVAALRACWGPDPVSFKGRYFTIPPSRIGPKPVQKCLRIWAGAVTEAATRRAARIGDGLTIGFRNWEASLAQAAWYHESGGTGPIVFRAGPMLADAEHVTPPSTWTEPSIVADLARAAKAGIDHVVWDLNIVDTDPADQVAAMTGLAERIGLS
ncbi:TIGR03619 family F420-dependent LLM class oxidoreductase [Actinoplanes sp. NPDC026623]|uniref:TIGR03619 family F420-dependent LLM class oxidoreductase n=1 Tax=Actinoplanes sp. NPDC026623 TaxID=3155610 RepID=UPI003407D5DA